MIEAKDAEILRLQKELEKRDILLNSNGTNSSIPTSQTPIGKKKVILNFAKNTGGKIGRKEGHKKDLKPTGKVIKKQVKDYRIIVDYTEHEYIEYQCECCGKIFHEPIPNHLKEECQYGSNVKSIALTLGNVGNVPFNKTRRILSGLSMEEIEPCEGYLSKLQKTASKGLENFIQELHDAIIQSEIVYWDDTVIQINKQQSCMRYYGNEDICLFKAHEKKNKEGLDNDKILSLLNKHTVVEHDHNKVNYNPEYEFINAECCQHLLRDLRKVEINIPRRTWCKNMLELFQKYDHQRKELIKQGMDTFTEEEINEFILQVDHCLLKDLEENEKVREI